MMEVEKNTINQDLGSRFKYKYEMSVDLEKSEWAEIAKASLEVDKELRPTEIIREMSVSGSCLIIKFQCTDLKMLRTSVSSFFDMLSLVSKTINEFG